MEIPTYFDEFLQNTGPTPYQREVMIREHNKLRERLMADLTLKPLLMATFIQGSQRRFTANRGNTQHPCDVDVVAVTNMPRNSFTAAYAHSVFQPFLERYYPGKYSSQDRSWCITVDPEVTIDLVPTSEPDSPELRETLLRKSLREWNAEHGSPVGRALGIQSLTGAILEDAKRDREFDKSEPLWIPDRTLQVWEKTHPLYLIGWTARKNEATNGHFIHVVRVLKWWRREMEPLPKYPKGYTLEHLIGECCPSGIKSLGAGVAESLAEMVVRYEDFAVAQKTPVLPARGITDPPVDVMRRVSGADFAGFYEKVVIAAELARRALEANTIQESAKLWGQLLGPEFPPPPKEEATIQAGYTAPSKPARLRESRFA